MFSLINIIDFVPDEKLVIRNTRTYYCLNENIFSGILLMTLKLYIIEFI